ncbi:MAG: hypothetical protein ACTSRA_00235 [Promethearchaeota archaeon]|nr:MAG: hypothetical protein [Helarchaeota virus Nidhogg Meg22_1012]URC17382.1 MAG: hypothetical protein [Helarchaeota virus Nidhogg Meg22_1214]
MAALRGAFRLNEAFPDSNIKKVKKELKKEERGEKKLKQQFVTKDRKVMLGKESKIGPISEALEDFISNQQYDEAAEYKFVDKTPDIPIKFMPGLTCNASDSFYYGMGVYPGQAACAMYERFGMCGNCPNAIMMMSHPLKKPSRPSISKRYPGEVSEGMIKVPMDEMNSVKNSGGRQKSRKK